MENEIETIIRDKKLLLVNKNAKLYIEELEEDNYCYHNLIKMQNKREFRSKFLKEFQEEKGNNWYPDFDEIYKRYDKLKQENLKLKEDFAVLKKSQMISNDILTELEEWLKEQWYEIEPKGTGINFNCEYDSEEDYVRGMETKSKLDTLKNSLNKIQELKEKYK